MRNFIKYLNFKHSLHGYYKLRRETLHKDRIVDYVLSSDQHTIIWDCCGSVCCKEEAHFPCLSNRISGYMFLILPHLWIPLYQTIYIFVLHLKTIRYLSFDVPNNANNPLLSTNQQQKRYHNHKCHIIHYSLLLHLKEWKRYICHHYSIIFRFDRFACVFHKALLYWEA